MSDKSGFKGLLYSPEVLGGLSVLTQGLAGKTPDVVMPSLIQGVQTASAFSKLEDEEEKRKFIALYEKNVPDSDKALFRYNPELYIKNREYAKREKNSFINFKDLNSGDVKMFDVSTNIGRQKLKIFRSEDGRNVIQVPSQDKSTDLSKKATTDAEKKVLTAIEMDGLLEVMEVLHDDKFSTYLGKSQAVVGELVSKSGIFTNQKDIETFMIRRAEWEAAVQQYFNAYRKNITGVAAGEKEIKLLENSVPNVNDPPAVFKAKVKLQRQLNNMAMQRNKEFLDLGIGKITRDKDNKPTGKYKEYLQKNKLKITEDVARPYVTDLVATGYSDAQIKLKIKQAFGQENVEEILTMLGLK
tara:strand:- start:22170 stop:23237 length:1068 start_codon:yes stop_codon:yes gene_type:complete